MKRGKTIWLLCFLLLIGLLFISCTPAVEQCSADADCVPAQCCHPTSTVNKANAPDCSGVLCTAVCEGPIDCGAGEIKCVSNKCTIIAVQ